MQLSTLIEGNNDNLTIESTNNQIFVIAKNVEVVVDQNRDSLLPGSGNILSYFFVFYLFLKKALSGLSATSEPNAVSFSTLIDQAEIIFDNELSSQLPNENIFHVTEHLEATLNQNHDSLQTETTKILLSIENIKGSSSNTIPEKSDAHISVHTVSQKIISPNTEKDFDDTTEEYDEYVMLPKETHEEISYNERFDPDFIPEENAENTENSRRNGDSPDTSEYSQSDENLNTFTSNFKSKRKINKELRMKGKNFIGFRRPKNQKRTFQDVERDERKLGARCSSETCKRSSKRKCNEITEATRTQIFSAFWHNLSWEERKVYVANLVSKQETIRKTKSDNNPSRRSSSLFYRLNLGQETVPVCKNMFLKTLGLKEWSVKSWVEKSQYGVLPNVTQSDQRFSPRTTENDKTISTFLEKLPKLPSHYCRKDTKKLYLEQDFCSYSDLYKAFIQYSKEENVNPASRNTLIKWVKKKNIGIFKPRKDLCDTCVEYECGNLSLEDWEQHRKDKDRAQKEKLTDKERAIECSLHLITVDLQAVKTCPYLQASSLYFKTKLVCHNYTVYDLSTHHCTCYWFSEIDADLQASTFASLLVDYLKRKYLLDIENKKEIVIYSDGCTYQNRNSTLANALLSLSYQYNITITQKFLVKGHSQMECDSVHATIEKKIKNKNIEIPNDYHRLTEEARQRPFPYEVVAPTFDFFQNFNFNLVYSSIRPGKKSSDPTVTQIRALKYKEGRISYTLDFDQEFVPLPHRPKAVTPSRIDEFPQLFPNRLSVSKKKFDDLQTIKTKVNQNYWSFYDNLLTK